MWPHPFGHFAENALVELYVLYLMGMERSIDSLSTEKKVLVNQVLKAIIINWRMTFGSRYLGVDYEGFVSTRYSVQLSLLKSDNQ